MKVKLLFIFALLLTAVTGAWADFMPQNDDVWDSETKTLTVNSDPADGFYSWNDEIQHLVIASGVTSIGDYAFEGCTSLTTVIIPASVTSIGNNAFNGCTSLATVSIPASVTTIGDYAFEGCTSLTIVDIPASVTSIGNSAFKGCTSLATVSIPDGVTSIGDYAFYDCTSLTTVSIPASVTSVGSYAFENTRWLGNQPNGVVYVGKVAYKWKGDATIAAIADGTVSISPYAFESCTSLATVIIPASVTSIGDFAFQSCQNLTSVIIPASVTSIGQYAFQSCTDLEYVYVLPTTPPTIGYYPFNACPDGLQIAVPAQLLKTYKEAENWSGYAAKMVGVLNETTGFDNTFATGNYEYTRTFYCGVAATLCLPFTVSYGQISPYGKVYTFAGVDKTTEPTWTVVMREDDPSNNVTGNLEANTPYLFVPYILAGKSKGDAMPLIFTGEVATAANAGYTSKAEGTAGAYWTFQGVYYNVAWNDGNADLGSVYGFAAQSHDGGSYTVNPGDFVKAMAGASIAPFRAFLQYTPAPSNAPRRGAAEEALPSRMSVRLVNADGDVTAIGTIDTKTGEIRFDSDAWYTLDGRRLNGKPAQKGVYINNGKKIIVK